jgi:hypothetical protein
MPDLSEFSSGTTLDMIPNFIMRGKGPKEHKSLGYVVAFIRLVDKALIEYELCRESLKEAAEGQSHRVAAYFRAADHLENCINSARRAILLGRRVRRDQDAPSVDKKALPSAIEAERLDYFRHSIEHVDEKLQKGELKKDDAVMLTLYADRFGIGDRQESFEWFADLIKRLHQIAVVLADAEVPGTF